MNARRPLPPHAKNFSWHHHGDQGFVFCGPLAWEWSRHDSRRKLALPPDSSPADFRWPVAGLALVVIDTGADDDFLRHLAHELLLAGAVKAIIIPHHGNLAVFGREANDGAA